MALDIKMLDEKIQLIQWLSTVEDTSIIKKLIQIRNEEAKDWWDSISEDERTSIEEGIADADNDRLVSHAEARKLYEKWL
ncbi:MAG: hypothetical protein PHO94_06690 [Petrimonas sp.]|nr:hypothetical protein [Petrimonas sp.]